MSEMGQKPPDTPLESELEAAIQKGIRPFLRYYQQKMKLAPTAEAVQTVKAGGEMSPREVELELQGITAVSIEKMWERLQELRTRYGEQLLLPQGDIGKALQHGTQPSPIADGPLSGLRLKQLFDASYYTARFPVFEWARLYQHELIRSGLSPENPSPEFKLYRRYDTVLSRSSPPKTNEIRISPEAHLSAGFGTALRVNWGLFNTLPAAYERYMTEQGAEPKDIQFTEKGFEQLQDAVHELVQRLSSAHMNLVVAFQRALIRRRDENFEIPFVRHLCLRRVGKKLRLDIEPAGLRKIVAELETFTKSLDGATRYQCPARFAHAKNEDKNLITEVNEWVRESVRRYCLPQLAAYTAVSRDLKKLRESG